MKRPRVIIADADAAFRIPLINKFVEEYFNKIDLEIITEKTLFDKLFSTSQAVDVLIVSEDFYGDNLQKHTISHIFVMQRQVEDGESTVSLNVHRIARYSNLKDIFMEIVGKSGASLEFEDDNRKQAPQIILVTSAAGGVGKTTVAMGLACALAKNYKRVLYINADRLQTFQAMLSVPAPITSSDVYKKLISGSKNIYADIRHVIREEVFQYLPPFKGSLTAWELSYGVFQQIAVSAKESKAYDFVIVDADCTFDKWKSDLIGCADKLIVVTTQSKAAVYATNRLHDGLSESACQKSLYICNKYNREEENFLLDVNYRPPYTINEYLPQIYGYDRKTMEMLSKEKDIQKLAYLLI